MGRSEAGGGGALGAVEGGGAERLSSSGVLEVLS